MIHASLDDLEPSEKHDQKKGKDGKIYGRLLANEVGMPISDMLSAAQKDMDRYNELGLGAIKALNGSSELPALMQISGANSYTGIPNSDILSAAQKHMEQQDSLRSIVNDAIEKNFLVSACDPVSSVDACFGSLGSQYYEAAQKFMEQNEFMSSQAERALNGYLTRSEDHLLKGIQDMDSLEGSLASKLDTGGVFDRYTIPIAPLRSYQEEPVTLPVFDLHHCIALEHREEHAETRKERPLVKKKNCPEEVYTPNEGQIRDRLFDALNTYLDDHKKTIQQEIDKFPTLDTEADRKEYEDLRFMYQYPFDQAAKIESQDILLLPEDELRQRFRENPEIRTYIYMGLQTILRKRKQSNNDPDFIEEQRRKVAYNFNSFKLDEDTDYLLSYETMRWLEKNKPEADTKQECTIKEVRSDSVDEVLEKRGAEATDNAITINIPITDNRKKIYQDQFEENIIPAIFEYLLKGKYPDTSKKKLFEMIAESYPFTGSAIEKYFIKYYSKTEAIERALRKYGNDHLIPEIKKLR